MDSKVTDYFGIILTSLGMAQWQDRILFWFSLASTVLGLVITLTKQVIIPLIQKAKNKELTPDDVLDGAEKAKDLIEDTFDDGKINGSNKK